MQGKQQHSLIVRAGICRAGAEGASGAGDLQSSTWQQNTHEHRLLQPASAPRCALGPMGPPPHPVLVGNASAPPGCSASTRATLCCHSPPSTFLLVPPSFSSCSPAPVHAEHTLLLPPSCFPPQDTAPNAQLRHPHGTPGGTKQAWGCKEHGQTLLAPRPEWLLPLSPNKTLQQFFLQSLGGQEECLIIWFEIQPSKEPSLLKKP